MSNIAAINPKGDKAALVILDDGSKPVWTPSLEQAQKLLEVGKPIPETWTIKEGDYGPQAFPPKEGKGFGGGGGPAAYRNTKEGQAYEQERMDRRTALMQAVAVFAAYPNKEDVPDSAILGLAGGYYEWLRQNRPADGTAGSPATTTSRSPGTTSQSVSAPRRGGIADGDAQRPGEGDRASARVGADTSSAEASQGEPAESAGRESAGSGEGPADSSHHHQPDMAAQPTEKGRYPCLDPTCSVWVKP